MNHFQLINSEEGKYPGLREQCLEKCVEGKRNSLLYSPHAPFWACVKHGIILYEI
jgi:hypothetical protein